MRLESIGVFLPARKAPTPERYGSPCTPNLDEVHLLGGANGTLVPFDSNSEVYTFTFDADSPAPSPAPWPLVPVTRAG